MSAATVGLRATDCSVQRERLEAFRAKPFSVDRDLTMRVDGRVRGHEVARLSWDGKKLSKTVLSKEPKDAAMKVSGDPSVSLRFACAGWKETDGGGLEFRSSDGAVLDFRVGAGGALLPVGWEGPIGEGPLRPQEDRRDAMLSGPARP